MRINFFLFLIACFSILIGCNKQSAPYIVFEKSDYKPIEEQLIYVNLNDTYELVVDNGFVRQAPRYMEQKNNEEPTIIVSENVSKERHGWNGRKCVKFETVKLKFEFDDSTFSVGDLLTISSEHSNIKKEISIKIK